jgi:hypothetical protein
MHRRYKTSSIERHPTWVRKLTPRGEILPPADSKNPTSHEDLKNPISPESFQSWKKMYGRLQATTHTPPFQSWRQIYGLSKATTHGPPLQKVIQQCVHTTYGEAISPVQPPFECIRPSSDTDNCTHTLHRKIGDTPTRSLSEPATGALNRSMRVARRMLLPCIDTPPPIDTPQRRVSFSPTVSDAVYVERARRSLCLPTVSILKR